MKIALVCDWLTLPGGAEKVLLELHRMYPKAPIYTSQYRPKKITWFKDADVRTGWLNFFPAFLRKYIGLFRQFYFSHLDLSAYDLVISVTGAEAKAVKTHSATHSAYHISYCHVPTQYYWRMYDQYLKDPGFGVFNPLARLGLRLLVKPLRQADYVASQKVDQFVTISHYAARQIREYYHRDAKVIAPPVEITQFSTDFSTGKAKTDSKVAKTAPYVIACRQANWKRIDLAISACLELQRPLLVIGDGAEHAKLVKLAQGSDLITFVPWLSSRELATYLQTARAYIFPSLEPFGIAAVEALAAGCPVIAYADGGSRDIVLPEKNGVLFSEQTVASLVAAIQKFESMAFNRSTVSASADRFSAENFRAAIKQLISASL